MRITIVLGAFLPVPPLMGGAVEKFWFAMAQEFARRDNQVVQISRALPALPPRESIAGVDHIRVAGFDTPASSLLLKLRDLIYSGRVLRVVPEADVIVTNTFWLPLLLRHARAGKIYVHVARYPKGQLRFYNNAARLQTGSRAIAAAIERQAPALASRTKVIPYNAPVAQSAEPPPPTAKRERILLFVGRVHPEKGVHVLVEAFVKEMNQSLSNWRLELVGPADTAHGGGGESYLAQLRTAAGATDRIGFRGAIFDALALEREYRRARIFVYPSLAETGETFGLAALEAMSHGCATVVSELACFTGFVADRATGFSFDHRGADPASVLARTLAEVANDETLLATVAAAGLRQAGDYSIANIASQFLADFESLATHG
jgi:glycosyltransferase involved in cell wall biosynthesis